MAIFTNVHGAVRTFYFYILAVMAYEDVRSAIYLYIFRAILYGYIITSDPYVHVSDLSEKAHMCVTSNIRHGCWYVRVAVYLNILQIRETLFFLTLDNIFLYFLRLDFEWGFSWNKNVSGQITFKRRHERKPIHLIRATHLSWYKRNAMQRILCFAATLESR